MEVYTNPKGLFGTLLAIGSDFMLIANPKETELSSIAAKLENGQAVQTKGAKLIRFSAITRVRYNEKNAGDLDISYRDGRNCKDVSFTFSSTEDRSSIFAQLKQTMDGVREKREELNAVTAAISPAICTLVFAGGTYLAFRGAQDLAAGGGAEVTGRNRLIKHILKWLMEFLGPTGILILGGVIIAICIFLMIKRIGNPPVFVSLER